MWLNSCLPYQLKSEKVHDRLHHGTHEQNERRPSGRRGDNAAWCEMSVELPSFVHLATVSAACAIGQARHGPAISASSPGVYPPGPLNAITDVDGVRVGHTTIVEGDRVRTGVTAIVPHGGNVFQDKVAGAVFVGNAFGKLAGSTQVDELGTIETPIVLTNTLSVGTAVDAVVALHDRAAGQRAGAIGQCAGRRDQRRRTERHPRAARHARARAGGDRQRDGGRGRRKAASARAPARSTTAGRAASAPRRGSCPDRPATAATPSACSHRRTSAAT